MKYIILLFFSIVFFVYSAQAQNPFRSYKGRVVDSATLKPLPDATISIFRASDTLLLNFGFTTPNGNFTLTTRSNDSLLIVVSIFGYEEHFLREESSENGWSFRDYGDIKLAKIPLSFKGFTMKTSAIRMKGDTIEINASRFKVLPGSDVAQLFKKIPGFEVNVKGEIKVNGTAVNTITVDGSDFFGNNPGMVSKNLTADMIETVQVFDERNPDGSPKEEAGKVINLKLKKGKRNGSFGDIMAGYGSKTRYESGFRFNDFKNDRKLSFIANSNNINETGFDFGFENWHNALNIEKNGTSNNDGFYYYSGNSGEGNINHKTSTGFTYFNEFANKRKFSMNVYANRNQYNSISASKSINPLNDSTQRLSNDSTNNNGLIYGSSYEMTYSKEIDSTGEYDIGLSGFNTDNRNTINGVNSILLNQTVLNKGKSIVRNENLANSIKINSSYRRFLRKNKLYTFFVATSYKSANNNDRFYQFLENNNDTFNNLNERTLRSSEWLTKLYMSMPIYKKLIFFNISSDRWQLMSKSLQITNGAINQYSGIFEQTYEKKVDSLSIEFGNKQIQYSFKPFISARNKYLYTTAGVTFLHLDLSNSNAKGDVILSVPYSKALPFFTLSYFPKKMYLFFTANKSTVFPTVSDLLPVLNLSNNYERRTGNQALSPTDNYGIRTYSSFHKLKGFKFFYMGGNASLSNNAKIWVNRQSSDGIIVKTPENASGKKNLVAWANMSKKLSKIMNLELSLSESIDKNPLIINQLKAFGISKNSGIDASINFSYVDSLDLNAGVKINRNSFRNTLNDKLNYNQNVFAYYFEIRALIKSGTEFNTSINISDQRNVPGIGKIIPVWNAYIQQSLGAKSMFHLKLTAYDILKQNTNISRTATDNFIYINQSNRLQQYFMLTLVYKIKKMGGEEEMNYVY